MGYLPITILESLVFVLLCTFHHTWMVKMKLNEVSQTKIYIGKNTECSCKRNKGNQVGLIVKQLR